MKINDQKIQELLNRAEVDLPSGLDQKITQMVLEKKERSFSFFRLRKSSLIPAALSLLLALFLLLPSGSKQKEESISEIRTEFFIKDKNIKIIWIQKKDFKLNLNKETVT